MTRNDLEREVGILLDIPHLPYGASPSRPIVNAVFTSIVEALWRGETIKIQGLGTFYIKEVPEHLHQKSHFQGKKFLFTERTKTKAKKLVMFEPSKNILKELNGLSSRT